MPNSSSRIPPLFAPWPLSGPLTGPHCRLALPPRCPACAGWGGHCRLPARRRHQQVQRGHCQGQRGARCAVHAALCCNARDGLVLRWACVLCMLRCAGWGSAHRGHRDEQGLFTWLAGLDCAMTLSACPVLPCCAPPFTHPATPLRLPAGWAARRPGQVPAHGSQEGQGPQGGCLAGVGWLAACLGWAGWLSVS
jgi:hypothetical protein